MKIEELNCEHKIVIEEMFIPERQELPQWVLLGDELIEFDESMAQSGLCLECEQLGYCKRDKERKTESPNNEECDLTRTEYN